MDYTFQKGVNISQDFTLLKELQDRSMGDCANACTAATWGCNSFEYNSVQCYKDGAKWQCTISKCRLYSMATGVSGIRGSDAVFIAAGNSF
jgi:hypothetical protein